eukprot:1185648-Prorocentrum_minimum.AAC.8
MNRTWTHHQQKLDSLLSKHTEKGLNAPRPAPAASSPQPPPTRLAHTPPASVARPNAVQSQNSALTLEQQKRMELSKQEALRKREAKMQQEQQQQQQQQQQQRPLVPQHGAYPAAVKSLLSPPLVAPAVKHDLVKFGASTTKPKEESVKNKPTIVVSTSGTAVVFTGQGSFELRGIFKKAGQGTFSRELKG